MHKHGNRRRSRSRSRDRKWRQRPRDDGKYEERTRHRSRSGSRSRERGERHRQKGQSRSRSQSPQRRRYRPQPKDRDRFHRHDDFRSTRVKEEVKVKTEPQSPKPEEAKKQGPNFGLSGKLAEDTNVYNGIVIKYNEPSEARKPKRRWRMYAFKGETDLPMLPIHRQSAYLLGRERKVADIPIDHPSCSKQHAVLQYRLVKYTRDDGTIGQRVRPYIIDLESSNGTYVNNQKIEPRRYVELFEKDVIKFGYSTREYVILHEESKDAELDDNVEEEEEATEDAQENANEPETANEEAHEG